MTVSKETKQAVIAAADFCCHYCSEHATTVDHKLSSSNGGTDGRNNLVAACEPCNTAKGSMGYELFSRYIRRFGRPDRPRNWYQNSNWYVSGAISKILVNVELERAFDIVLTKFADGDPVKAMNKIRRSKRVSELKIDMTELDKGYAGFSIQVPGPAF